jgi:hypothetical protein
MKAVEAERIINSVAFKPGFRFAAVATSEYEVGVGLYIETVDTSYPGPDGQCRKPIQVMPTVTINVRFRDYLGVLRALLDFDAETNSHESREFLKVRIDGRWEAPFHPHTDIGDELWERTAA